MTSLLLSKQKRYKWAGFFGLLSLALRQTNAVWIAFIAGTSLLEILDDKSLLESFRDASLSLPRIVFLFVHFLRQCILKLNRIVIHLWAFILAIFAFVVFILWNGGITLGDKENHAPVLHYPQLFYFLAFTCFFGLFALGEPFELMKSLKTIMIKKWYQIALFTPVIYYFIQNYTIAHPFLLADNRHFTFYIWRYFLRHDRIRLLLSPCYSICFVLLANTLEHKPLIWIMIYLIALSLTLIPSPLIEFRYFIIPYYIWRLHMKPICGTNPFGMTEIVWHTFINMFVFTLFLFYPFSWVHEPGVEQRFMW